MRTIIVLTLCFIISPFSAHRVEAFAVQPQQMKPILDNAFKKQNKEMIEAASRQAAIKAAEQRASDDREKASQTTRTAMYWGAGLIAGVVVFRRLRA